jgi:hypothetical protein
MIAYAGEGLIFERNRGTWATAIANTAPAAANTTYPLELPQLQPNDPKVRYALVMVMVRAAAGDNYAAEVKHAVSSPGLGRSAGIAYTSGTTMGGLAGPFMVAVGDVNGRSIAWSSTSTATKVWIYVAGWWRNP